MLQRERSRVAGKREAIRAGAEYLVRQHVAGSGALRWMSAAVSRCAALKWEVLMWTASRAFGIRWRFPQGRTQIYGASFQFILVGRLHGDTGARKACRISCLSSKPSPARNWREGNIEAFRQSIFAIVCAISRNTRSGSRRENAGGWVLKLFGRVG